MDIDRILIDHTATNYGALSKAERAAVDANREYRAELARFESSEDWNHLTAEGRKARREGLAQRIGQAEREAFEAIARAIEDATRLETFGRADARLPDADLARAACEARFVEEDIADMSGDEIADAIEAALLERDRARAWLLVRYTERRERRLDPGGKPVSTPRVGASIVRAREFLADPKRAKAIEAAREIRERAKTARRTVEALRADEHAANARDVVRRQRHYGL